MSIVLSGGPYQAPNAVFSQVFRLQAQVNKSPYLSPLLLPQRQRTSVLVSSSTNITSVKGTEQNKHQHILGVVRMEERVILHIHLLSKNNLRAFLGSRFHFKNWKDFPPLESIAVNVLYEVLSQRTPSWVEDQQIIFKALSITYYYYKCLYSLNQVCSLISHLFRIDS